MNRKEKLLKRFPKIDAGNYSKELSIFIDKDNNYAIIPPGFTVSRISKENIIFGSNVSLVIYQIPEEQVKTINWENKKDMQYIQEKFNQFVWIPVNFLDANGTINGGKTFDSKFGRRQYNLSLDEFKNFHEFYGSFCEQVKSVNMYGGFYISRYVISCSKQDERNFQKKPFSVKGLEPWVYLQYFESEQVANNVIEKTEFVSSHLIYGAEYDCCLEWIVKSGALSKEELECGAIKYAVSTFYNKEDFKNSDFPIKTGESGEKYSVNNLYEFFGNVWIRTQEFIEDVYRCEDTTIDMDNYIASMMMSHVVRGYPFDCAFPGTATQRNIEYDYSWLHRLGIRACLYMKPIYSR